MKATALPNNGNNIDRRLDWLTERHEALAQSPEIIAGMQRETQEHLRRLVDVVSTLARIVESHERRLGGLESQ